jgi:FkbM family methyltransferase
VTRRRARVDLLELALASLLAFTLGILVTRAWLGSSVERDALIERLGPQQWSRFNEELIARDFFEDRRGGVFVDVGAADARVHSNTYVLETQFGWSGIAIDALAHYGDSFRQYRPRTKFFAYFVSDRSDATEKLFVDDRNQELTSATKKFMLDRGRTEFSERDVPTITLTDLLDREGIKQFDFLSMDIELAEPKALTGFEIDRFRPALICIETHPQTRQWIMDYFVRHGYTLQTKYMYLDRNNFWFARAD